MLIIFEGNDASGKSTLADEVARRTGLKIQRSEGPEKTPGEINRRIARYLDEYPREHIFDRHPCISHNIYRRLSDWMSPVSMGLMLEFEKLNKLVVYCRPDNPETAFSDHVVADERDTKEHLEAVASRYMELQAAYDEWALKNAHVIYRRGHQFDFTVSLIVTLYQRFRYRELQPAPGRPGFSQQVRSSSADEDDGA